MILLLILRRIINAVVGNFYNLYEKKMGDNFEDIRQAIDVGGPTMCHAARKSFINTVIIPTPNLYNEFCQEIIRNKGFVSLKLRFEFAQEASKILLSLMKMIDEHYSNTSYETLLETYEIV